MIVNKMMLNIIVIGDRFFDLLFMILSNNNILKILFLELLKIKCGNIYFNLNRAP